MTYRADPDELQRLIDRAADIDTAIGERLEAVNRRVAMMHTHWSGSAATAHQAHHAAWTRAAADMRDALNAMRSATVRARTNYVGNAAHQQQMWPS